MDTATQREASVREFLSFLRAAGVTEPQIPTFQRIAEQLLIGTGADDLSLVSAEAANRWRDSLRARNADAQMAVISRGISAVQAFQRKRVPAAAPAPAPASAPETRGVEAPPVPRPPVPTSSPTVPPSARRPVSASSPTPPKPATSSARKAITLAALAIVVIGSVIYTVLASRRAVQESRNDAKIVSQRNAQRKIGVFYPSYTFTRQTEGCAAVALAQVNRAVALANSGEPGATAQLEDALAKEPSCVAAARVLTILEGRVGGLKGVERLSERFRSRADANPKDAPAQLMAAYGARQMGDGEGYRKYLERAEAADPNQPLLGNAWGSYWDLFAQPRDFVKELTYYRQEVDRSADPGTISNLANIYLEVGDYERAKAMCDRFFAAVPDDRDVGRTRVCLEVALSRQDAADEAAFLKRYWDVSAGPHREGPAGRHQDENSCAHADLAGMYLKYTCRFDRALEEAQTAIEKGCGLAGSGQRRNALLALHRYEEAAEPPAGGRYWEGVMGESQTQAVSHPDRDNRAQALGMLGRDEEAQAILRPITESDERARILSAMIDQGVLHQRVESSSACPLPTARAERLGFGAAGYIGYNLLDDARPLIDEALAIDPRSPRGWSSRVYLLSIDDKLQEAVQQGEAALALGVDDAYLAGNLGYVYQRLGHCDKAIPLFRKKLAGQPWSVPNYTNLAKCLEATGQGSEAAQTWQYVQGGRPRTFWWMYVGVVVAAVFLYLGGKLALIKLMPARFGHLRFP